MGIDFVPQKDLEQAIQAYSSEMVICAVTENNMLTVLTPPIVDAFFAENAPWTLSLTKLNTPLPSSWQEQMELFGMV